MPNGGYPINLVTPIGDSGFVLHAEGATVHIKRKEFPEPESTRVELVSVGELEVEQVAALLFHVLEWGSDLDVEAIRSITFLGERVGPRFTKSTCRYDY